MSEAEFGSLGHGVLHSRKKFLMLSLSKHEGSRLSGSSPFDELRVRRFFGLSQGSG
jgi:hypothetical protein